MYGDSKFYLNYLVVKNGPALHIPKFTLYRWNTTVACTADNSESEISVF